jgi:hypothetical protein
MATTAAQMAAYLYPEEEDPEGAFNWWLSPCGGTDLVPEDLKKVFDILSTVANGVSSFKTPKKLGKGSRKKGDNGNPKDQSKPRSANTNKNNGGTTKKKKCRVSPKSSTKRLRGNTLQKQSCVNDETHKEKTVITSLKYAAGAKTMGIKKECRRQHSQACFFYSSAIRENPHWATMTCREQAATVDDRFEGKATNSWSAQHKGVGWDDEKNRAQKLCDRDEYPPAYFLHDQHPAYIWGGIDERGQAVRFIPADDNRGAGQYWRSVCLVPPVAALSDADFETKVNAAPNKQVINEPNLVITQAFITVDTIPEFSFNKWGHSANPPANDGLNENKCWPSGIASKDPGFALLDSDPWYKNKPRPYDYTQDYKAGINGD